MKKAVKIALLLFVGIVILGAVLLDHYFAKPFREIAALETRYFQTQRNMTRDEVVQLMGPPHRTYTHDGSGGSIYWDDDSAPLAQETQVRQSIRYTVSTFFLPVSFEFYFDSENQLVGRHRLD